MDHVLAQVAELGIVSAPAPEALKVGHINHAAAIYGAFVVDAEKQGVTTLDTIRSMSELSYTEFAKQCKDAQGIADNVDKGNGFVKAEGAKGQDSYGPKRRLLNQRLSEAKRLFGVFKMAPAVLQEKGYWSALSAARDYLSEQNLTWDGQQALTSEEKADKHAASVRTGARAAAMDCNPQKKGESDEDYLLRVRTLMADAVDKAETEEFNKDVKTLFDSLTKKHNSAVLSGVFQMMLENMDEDGLSSLQGWIQEELVICALAAQQG